MQISPWVNSQGPHRESDDCLRIAFELPLNCLWIAFELPSNCLRIAYWWSISFWSILLNTDYLWREYLMILNTCSAFTIVTWNTTLVTRDDFPPNWLHKSKIFNHNLSCPTQIAFQDSMRDCTPFLWNVSASEQSNLINRFIWPFLRKQIHIISNPRVLLKIFSYIVSRI